MAIKRWVDTVNASVPTSYKRKRGADDLSDASLELEDIHGYRHHDVRNNLYYATSGGNGLPHSRSGNSPQSEHKHEISYGTYKRHHCIFYAPRGIIHRRSWQLPFADCVKLRYDENSEKL